MHDSNKTLSINIYIFFLSKKRISFVPSRFKYNVDIFLSSPHNKVGISMYIHDIDGCFVLAKTTWFTPLCSVNIGEALGLRQMLRWKVRL